MIVWSVVLLKIINMQDFKIIDEKNNYTQFLDNQVMVMFKTSISINKDSIGNYLNMIFLFDKI